MVYAVEFSNAAYKIAKKLPRNIRNAVVDHAKKIAADPYRPPQLRGRFSFLRSYHFTYKGTGYRIIYEISKKKQRVCIRLADARENIYRRLKEMRIKPLRG